MTANYIKNIGQLATSRYDFQNHVDGYAYQHLGGAISCSVTIDGTPYTDIQSALTAISGYVPTTFPNATASVTGAIKLTGDLGGTYSSPLVSRLQATPVLSSSPTSGQILGYNGSGWGPISLGGDITGSYGSVTVTKFQGRAFSSNSPVTNQIIYWDGSQWKPEYPKFGTVHVYHDYAEGGATGGFVTSQSYSDFSSGATPNFFFSGRSSGEMLKIKFSGRFSYTGSGSGYIRCIIADTGGNLIVPGFSDVLIVDSSSSSTERFSIDAIYYLPRGVSNGSIKIQGKASIVSGSLGIIKDWFFIVEVVRP